MALGPDVAAPPPEWGGMEPGTPGGKRRRWRWSARAGNGEPKRGEALEFSADDVVARLEQVGYSEVLVQRVFLPEVKRLSAVLGIVTRRDRIIVARQLGTMVDAGLPFVQCLDIVIEQADNRGVARELGEARRLIKLGSPLASALRTQSMFEDAVELDGCGTEELPAALDAVARRLERNRRRK